MVGPQQISGWFDSAHTIFATLGGALGFVSAAWTFWKELKRHRREEEMFDTFYSLFQSTLQSRGNAIPIPDKPSEAKLLEEMVARGFLKRTPLGYMVAFK